MFTGVLCMYDDDHSSSQKQYVFFPEMRLYFRDWEYRRAIRLVTNKRGEQGLLFLIE